MFVMAIHVRFKCMFQIFYLFQTTLQVFSLDFAKVDLDVAYTYMLQAYVSVFRNRGSLNQRVNLCCVPLIPDGGAKRHKVYTGSGNRGPTSSPRDRSCIPCTGVLVVGGYKLGERGD